MRRLATTASSLTQRGLSFVTGGLLLTSTTMAGPELHWCQWGPWSVPLAACGSQAGLYARFRQRCCNSSLKRVFGCHGKSDEERRQAPYLPCSESPMGDDLDRHADFVYTGTVTSLISVLACVAMLIGCCLLVTRWRRQYRGMTLDRSIPVPHIHTRGAHGPQVHLGFSMSVTVTAQESPPPSYEQASRLQWMPPAPPPPLPRSPPPLYEEVVLASNMQHERTS